MIYSYNRFRDDFAFISSQKSHGWLTYNHSSALHLITLNSVFLILIIIAAIYWWNKSKSYAIYSLLFIGILLLGGYGGYGRYTLMAFPIPFMLYDYFKDKKTAYAVVLALSTVFWAYFLLQYATGYTGG